ncbi:ankyrin repeat and LEM domain-containing protein 1 [Drosophila bipectinata]|uniref:ankyrin repeat and LEM domain-containing protein 1 n=1 Tax=Drosophila bipectinata TaxID=42026 RepID=UPI001C8A141A|nr:ankyrin repeat and LEM domain-containing protein 1 [Drosophila bipectinata]
MSKFIVFCSIKNGLLQPYNHLAKVVNVRGIKYTLGSLSKKRTNFSPELEKTLHTENNFDRIKTLAGYVREHSKWFRKNEKGNLNFYNYLLLDPRVTNKLSERANHLHKMDVWYTFLRSIFYVGKGKSLRPLVHLNQAKQVMLNNNKITLAKDPKLALIVSIWNDKRGVLLLPAFRGISSRDAQTREASMIVALGMNHLANRRLGVYWGPAKEKFTRRQRKYMGIALLYKLMLRFLATDERELLPDVDKRSLTFKAAMAS